MSADEDALLAALGGGDGTLVDQLDAALTVAWGLAAGLNLTLPTSGGSPGPYRPGGTSWDLAYDQACARWGAAPKARTMAEKAALLDALVRGIDGAKHVTPTPAPTTGWSTLPVMTSSAVTSANDSHQSAVPSFQADGMHVKLPATGGSPGPGASAPSGAYQRCESYLAGWGNLTGTLYLRYDFTLLAGFPTNTNTWQTLAQAKNSSTGSPPLELMCGNKAGATNALYVQWHSASGAETGTEILGAATTGVPHSVVLGVQFSASSGTVSGWLDGVQAFANRSHGPTLYPLQSSYGKCGTYRDAAIGQASEIVFHGVAMGSTFASVTQ